MRQFIAALLCCLAVLLPPEAPAQDALHLYVSGGINEPVDRLGSRVKTGYGGSLALGYAPAKLSSEGTVELTIRGRYDLFKAVAENDRDIDFALFGLGVKFNVDPGERTNYYLLLEAGPTLTRWKEFSAGGREIPRKTTTNYHLSPAFGFERRSENFSPFVEFRLMNIGGDLIGDYFYLTASLGLRL